MAFILRGIAYLVILFTIVLSYAWVLDIWDAAVAVTLALLAFMLLSSANHIDMIDKMNRLGKIMHDADRLE